MFFCRLKVTDIAAIAAVARAHGVLLVVDNTFMSPFFQNPLDDGADIVGLACLSFFLCLLKHFSPCPMQVMHSVTKYINGHSDVVMGVVATNSDDLARRLRFLQVGSLLECVHR